MPVKKLIPWFVVLVVASTATSAMAAFGIFQTYRPAVVSGDCLLLESGGTDCLLLEDGSDLLLE